MNRRIETDKLTPQRLNISISVATYMVIGQIITLMVYMASAEPVPQSIEYIRKHVPTDIVVMADPRMYHHLLEYSNFLEAFNTQADDNINDEDYLTLWRRVQPQVFIGQPDDLGHDWWVYMRENSFQQVRDDLWIGGDLLATVVEGHDKPDMDFTAEQLSLAFGDCTRIEWEVTSADAVQLGSQSVEATGTREVCPFTTTTYSLSVFWIGGTETETVTVVVE